MKSVTEEKMLLSLFAIFSQFGKFSKPIKLKTLFLHLPCLSYQALTIFVRECVFLFCGRFVMAWAGVGVGMSLEPSPDPGSNYCHVSSMKDGGALANDGRVKPGDKLVRVDGFDCMGVPRAVIESRVLGPPNSEVVLEFERDRGVFKVTLRRQAQLL